MHMRNENGDHRSLPLAGANLHFPAMEPDQRAGNGKTKARAAFALGILALHLLEGLANLGRAPRSGMPMPVSAMVRIMAASMHMGAQRYAAAITSVNFTALDRRLSMICFMARRSPLHRTYSGADLLLHGDVLLFAAWMAVSRRVSSIKRREIDLSRG